MDCCTIILKSLWRPVSYTPEGILKMTWRPRSPFQPASLGLVLGDPSVRCVAGAFRFTLGESLKVDESLLVDPLRCNSCPDRKMSLCRL